METLGLESCHTGWLAINMEEETKGYWLLDTDEAFENYLKKYNRIFINTPIGLEDDIYTRKCDRLLRNKLGPYTKNTVFDPPIRPVLQAPTYGEASIISYEITGKQISARAWTKVPDIRLVNQLLGQYTELRDRVFESYPELLFQILNGGGPILQNKETKKGLRHRLELLKNITPYADDFFRDIKEGYRRNQVEESNILNAMVLAVFAIRSTSTEIKTIPEKPEFDSAGFPKAIHYV